MNSEGKDIGMFIVADGKENDVIASYHIRLSDNVQPENLNVDTC